MKIGNWITKYFLTSLIAVSQILLFLCSILSIIAVAARYVFNQPIAWSDELLIVGLVVMVMLPQGYLEATNDQLRMTALYNALSLTWKKVFEAVRLLITVGAGCYFAYAATFVIERNVRLGGSTATLHVPYWIIYFAIFLAFITITVGRCVAFYKFVKKGEEGLG